MAPVMMRKRPTRRQSDRPTTRVSRRAPAPRLLVEERRRRILELLGRQERVTVGELSRRFAVSAVTARGDLDALAEANQIVRTHGGGLARTGPQLDIPIRVKETIHHAEKVRIGRAAAQLVRDGETIILDSGTTTAEIARQLRRRALSSVNVITNALNIASDLAGQPTVRVIVMGGILRPTSSSLVGPQAEQTLSHLRADRLFLGADGFDPEMGLTTPDPLEAQLNALMVRVSREITVVVDASKFGRRSLSLIAPIDVIHRVITDSRADAAVVAALRDRGIEVVVT